ncbi:TonB-dependent receptor plug domain-containing protein [Spongiimicrobium salis]|uniref:TonB-dependent receptor plug domain-containing protein n=1 Tax=Spongiimicrobium salis TaxID=1667022 RepID=UPI00374D979F
MKSRWHIVIFYFFAFLAFGQEYQEKGITICWDTSSSMADRALEKEFSVLDKIFERNQNQTVQLLFFNVTIEEREFHIQNGDWQSVKKSILEQDYDGGTLYSLLKNKIKYDQVFVFTDGKSSFAQDVLTLPLKSVIVNSNLDRNVDFLKRTALLNRSRLMDFAAMQPKGKKVEALQKEEIRGSVYIENKPASNVRVWIKGRSDSNVTDNEGRFAIKGVLGDSLLIENGGTLHTMAITALEQEIFLKADVVPLEEVVLIEERLEEKTISAYGTENKEKIGYAVQSIGDESITPIQTNVSQSLQNKFSGVRLGNENDISQVTTRTDVSIISNNYGLIVIDGIPQQQSDSSVGSGTSSLANFSSLDPSIIADITILKGLAATNRYGALGSNGVILITTKNAVYDAKNTEAKNTALLKNNVYTPEEETATGSTSPIFKALKSAGSHAEAYTLYKSLRTFNGNRNIGFYLEAFNFFKETDPVLATRIISNGIEDNNQDLTTLRTTALCLSSIGAFEQALAVNEQIQALFPTIAQSYLNSALEKKAMGKYQEALTGLLALSEGKTNNAIKIRDVRKSLHREINNLIAKQKPLLNLKDVPAKYNNVLTLDVRLVFEWNDPDKVFEIQFVNPQKRFFNWKQDATANGDRVQSSIIQRSTSEEFEFYGPDVKGEWIINTRYIQTALSPKEVPLLLKCSVYKNYGRSNESKEEFLISLNTPGEKKMIHRFTVK